MKYTFIILNFVKSRSSYQEGMRILCADVTGGKACTRWFRIGTDIEYVSNSILGKEDLFSKHHSLIFKFAFTNAAYSCRY